MKNLFIIILSLMYMPFATSIAQAQLKITLSAEKSEFQLGEPIVVYVTLTNTDNEPLRVNVEVQPEIDIYHYFITDPDGQTKSFSPVYVGEPDEVSMLGRNESVGGIARIFYGGDGYYFPKPGDYKVLVRFLEVESNSLNLTVLPARNEAEEEQAKLILEHPEVGFFLMIEGSDALTDALAQIEILRENHPNSILTSYVLYALAKNYSLPKRNFLTKQPREADFPKAIEILESVKDKEIQLYYRSKIYLTLSQCLFKQRRIEEAKNIFKEYEQILSSSKKFGSFYNDELEDAKSKLFSQD